MVNSKLDTSSNEFIREVENNLYLGNLKTAKNKVVLHKYKIKRILSILLSRIEDEYKVEGIEYKYINVWDTENEDIISYFPECFDFINNAQTNGENVFIHCKEGRSRSATIVIAFLMKKYGYNLEQTKKSLSFIRQEIRPNPGFLMQLRLWHKMAFVLLGSDREYRLVLLSALKSRILFIDKFGKNLKAKEFSDNINSASICYSIKLLNAENNSKPLNRGNTYRCKKCSIELFDEINLIKNSDTKTCPSVYIEPQKWVLNAIISRAKSIKDILGGNINCFKCNEMLGTFNWNLNAFICECETHKGLDYYLIFKIDLNKLKF